MTGATLPSHGSDGGGSGAGVAESRDGKAGESSDAVIVARARLVSFSPPGPVSTVRVTKSAVTPTGGPLTINSTREPGGTPRWDCESTKSRGKPYRFRGTPSKATSPSGCGLR